MSRYRKIFNRIFTSLFFVALLFLNNKSFAADGEALFKANCGSCHKPDKDFTGPALQGWKSRVPNVEWVYKWVSNSTDLRQTDPYAKQLFGKWNSVMTAFGSQLKKEDIDAILKYVDDYKPPVPPTPVDGQPQGSDDSLLFGILTLVLALIDRKSTRLNSSHGGISRMPSSA